MGVGICAGRVGYIKPIRCLSVVRELLNTSFDKRQCRAKKQAEDAEAEVKKTKIRKSARGEDCSLRLGNCSSNDTVILAHIGKNKGVSIKCADYIAVYACYNCHDIIDGRAKSHFTRDELNTEKLRALEETLGKLFDKGLLNVV